MLKIRQEQMANLAGRRSQQFEESIARFLEQKFPEAKAIPHEEFIATIHRQTNRADAYGLATEQQVATYVTCAWLLGLDFDSEFPAAQQVLTSDQHSPEAKREWLAEWTEAIFTALETK